MKILILLSLLIILFILGVFISVKSLINYARQRRLKALAKKLQLTQKKNLFKEIYHDINGFSLSKIARHNKDVYEYTYGEIDFLGFILLINLIKPEKNTVFYDLGSGVGKAVILMSIVFDVKKSIGIELFAELHQGATKALNRIKAKPQYKNYANKIILKNQDFFSEKFTEKNTIIFINATGFFGDQLVKLTQLIETVPRDSIVITTSKKLQSKKITLLKETIVPMSFGPIRVFIQKRL